MKKRIKPLFAMSASVVCFGLLASLVRGLTIRQNIQPLHIVLYSLPFSLGALIPFVILERKRHPKDNLNAQISSRALLMGLLMGILSPFLYFTLFSDAFRFMGQRSYEAYSINALWPILSVIFSFVLFREKIKMSDGMALAVGFLGALWIVTKGQPTQLKSLWTTWSMGDSLALLAACTFALYTTMLGSSSIKPLGQRFGWATTIFGFQLISIASAFLISLISWRPLPMPDHVEFLLLFFAGALSFGLAYPPLFFARSNLDSVTFALFQNLTPFLAFILLALFFPAERAPAAYWIGLVLVAAANLFHKFSNKS